MLNLPSRATGTRTANRFSSLPISSKSTSPLRAIIMAPILRLKQAIDAIENDDHTVMDPAVADRVRTAWANHQEANLNRRRWRRITMSGPLYDGPVVPNTVYDFVAGLLNKAAELRENNDDYNDEDFWADVAEEVPWARDLPSKDLLSLTSVVVRHYLRADLGGVLTRLDDSEDEDEDEDDTDSSSDDDDELLEEIRNMLAAAKSWCKLLDLPEELARIDPELANQDSHDLAIGESRGGDNDDEQTAVSDGDDEVVSN
ncbi:hypothetical protein PG995_004748 [Apiospora arundinis]